jgi:preprotein translocase subunit SecG
VLQTILLVLHIFMALGLIGLILIQQGRGADAGAAFGSGASSTMFGARGAASFLTRATAALALVFFSNSFVLAYLASQAQAPKSLMEAVTIEAPAEQTGESAEGDLPPVPAKSGGSDLPTIPEEN